LIRPPLEHYDQLGFCISVKNKEQLEKVQRKSAEIVTGLEDNVHKEIINAVLGLCKYYHIPVVLIQISVVKWKRLIIFLHIYVERDKEKKKIALDQA